MTVFAPCRTGSQLASSARSGAIRQLLACFAGKFHPNLIAGDHSAELSIKLQTALPTMPEAPVTAAVRFLARLTKAKSSRDTGFTF